MKLRVDVIPEEGVDLAETIDSSEIVLDAPGFGLNAPMEFTGHAMMTGDDVYVEGRLRGSIDVDCSRCLEQVMIPLDLQVNVLYVQQEKLPEEESDGTAEAESNIAFYIGDTIDLLQEMRDLILINLPIKAVCRPDCKGLCASCGANLNMSECECRDSSSGSPFEKLMELKKRMQGE